MNDFFRLVFEGLSLVIKENDFETMEKKYPTLVRFQAGDWANWKQFLTAFQRIEKLASSYNKHEFFTTEAPTLHETYDNIRHALLNEQ